MSRSYKFRWVEGIYEDPELTSTQKLVALALSWYAHSKDGSNAFPSVATLARRASLSERTVQYALKALMRRGHLVDATPPEIRRRQARDGLPNVYQLKILRGATDAPGATGAEGGATDDKGGVHLLHPKGLRNNRYQSSSAVAASTRAPRPNDHHFDDQEDDDWDGRDEEWEDRKEWIEEQVHGFGPGEEPMVDSMLDRYHPKAIVAKIEKDRADPSSPW